MHLKLKQYWIENSFSIFLDKKDICNFKLNNVIMKLVNLKFLKAICLRIGITMVMLTCSLWIRVATSTTGTWITLHRVCAQYPFKLNIWLWLNKKALGYKINQWIIPKKLILMFWILYLKLTQYGQLPFFFTKIYSTSFNICANSL